MKFLLFTQLPKPKEQGIATCEGDNKELVFLGINTLRLADPRILFIGMDGIMLDGKEPDGFDKSGRAKYKYQQWWLSQESETQ